MRKLRVQPVAARLRAPQFASARAMRFLVRMHPAPVTATTFLPADSRIDGGRGWGLTFIDSEHGNATHLVNGVFALRRTTDNQPHAG
jgi:hypothetical protein